MGAGAVLICGEYLHSQRSSLAGIAEGDLLVGDAQILVRIDRNLVDAHLIVQVRAGGAAGLAYKSDHLAANHMLADGNRHGGKMPVKSKHIMAMVDHDLAAISGVHAGYGYLTITRGAHRSA